VIGIAKERIKSIQLVSVGFVQGQLCSSSSGFARCCLMLGHTICEKLRASLIGSVPGSSFPPLCFKNLTVLN
jgi:hypothetical protein